MEALRKELKGIIINYRRKDGTIGGQELIIKARYNEDGEFLCYDGYAKDVSERLESLNAEAEARRRAEFLVDLMSHDINNIDQGIVMLLEYILLDEELPQKYQDPLKMAVEQVNYATELIKNVKKLQSVLEEPINLKRIDTYNAITQASEATRGAFPQKTLEVEIGFMEDTVFILADSFVKDLFFNIFHNSMKHSKGKKVKLDIQTRPSKITDMIEIHICDYGPGIPDEEKKRILQRRLGAKGSGIGLTLVNYLLDRYEGFVQVKDRIEDDRSSGSRFIIVVKRG
jgi:signal transduction histidine kinase